MMCRPNALQKSGHIPGDPQQQDRSSVLPSRLSVRPPTAAASRCASANVSNVSIARSSTTVSGLRSKTHRPFEFAYARLFARPNPRFAFGSTRVTHGNSSRTISADPSDDSLSTTIVSWLTSPALALNEFRQSRNNSLTFQLTMQTLTSTTGAARTSPSVAFGGADRGSNITGISFTHGRGPQAGRLNVSGFAADRRRADDRKCLPL